MGEEYEILSQFQSAFFPRVHAKVEDRGFNTLYIPQQLIKGTILKQYVQENGALPLDQSLRIFGQLLEAILEL